MILGCMEVVAEGQTLSEKAGIGADEVQRLVQGRFTTYNLFETQLMVIKNLSRSSARSTVSKGQNTQKSTANCE